MRGTVFKRRGKGTSAKVRSDNKAGVRGERKMVARGHN